MTIVQDVLNALERMLLPKLQEIDAKVTATQEQIKALRELMEEKFRTVGVRFDHLEEKLAFDKRLTALEERTEKPN